MDLSALIFVALAVAWAVYLVPKALKHHDEVARTRSVEGFSRSLRVLARREPVDKRSARLVTPGRSAAAPAPDPAPAPVAPPTPAQLRARRAAAKRATKRRRNVLALLLLANVAVIAVAAFSLISWWYGAIPGGLLLAWLVACRLMVKSERRGLAPIARMPHERPDAEERPDAPATAESADASAAPAAETGAAADDEVDPMADTSTGIAAVVDPELWDPVSVPLPTYVGQPVATRSVRTIDLDSTGVWTSGRTEADAALAREADAADQAARRADQADGRAVGT